MTSFLRIALGVFLVAHGTAHLVGFAVPWVHRAIVFVTVFAAALLTSWAPAARAARVCPAEALRY